VKFLGLAAGSALTVALAGGGARACESAADPLHGVRAYPNRASILALLSPARTRSWIIARANTPIILKHGLAGWRRRVEALLVQEQIDTQRVQVREILEATKEKPAECVTRRVGSFERKKWSQSGARNRPVLSRADCNRSAPPADHIAPSIVDRDTRPVALRTW
jgi:hypothetical protein